MNMDFHCDRDGYVQVYTDGACFSNGYHGARAGFGIFWGDGHALNTSEPVSGRATNNSGEIQAATRAIEQAINHGIDKLMINTDSRFLIDAVTKWMPNWQRNGWRLHTGEPVKNQHDFKALCRVQRHIDVKYRHVEAHSGNYGNDMADKLAKAGAARYRGF